MKYLGTDSTAFDVEATTIDALAKSLPKVDFIKIDVEGAEPLAFRGATETIAANHGIQIVMEWSPQQIKAAGFDIDQFIGELSDTGLSPFVIEASGGTAATTWEAVAGMAYTNIAMRRP